MLKVLKILFFSCILVLIILIIKYKLVFQVELDGELLGYVNSKRETEYTIKEFLENREGNIDFIELNSRPNYTVKFVNKKTQTNEEEILLAIKEQSTTTYKSYAVKLNGELQETLKTLDEAEYLVNQIKEGYSNSEDLDLKIEEVYSEESNAYIENEVAVADLDGIVATKVEEMETADKIANSESELNGIYLSRPVSGRISSRFGERSSRRSGDHTGLDIATSYGTPIKPVSEGTVTFAGRKGSYGKLVIISHGNGIESYYGHCSSIYVKIGQKVDTKTTIAAVGSTGNSTGNHLHLEIRKNGVPLNPQKYLYK